MAEGIALRDPAQRLSPHRQCLVVAGAAARRHHGADRDESLRQQRFRLQQPLRLQRPFRRQQDYFKPKDDIAPDPVRGLAMRRTNIVPDIIKCELPLDNRRSPGYRRIEPHMAGNRFYMWIGQHETGRYSKAHRHGSAAVLICVKGKGYTYTWPSEIGTQPFADGKADQVFRVDYEPVGMVSAAPMSGDWFHQHFGIEQGAAAAHRLVRRQQLALAQARPSRREAEGSRRHRHPRRRLGDPL